MHGKIIIVFRGQLQPIELAIINLELDYVHTCLALPATRTASGIDRDNGDGLIQERPNSSASAMELRLSCTNPSILTWLKNVPTSYRKCTHITIGYDVTYVHLVHYLQLLRFTWFALYFNVMELCKNKYPRMVSKIDASFQR